MGFLIRFRWALSIVIILLVILGSRYLKRALVPNNELSIWFVENDPALMAYQDYNKKYGNDRVIVLLLYDREGLFQPEKLLQIQNLSGRLPTIDGVKDVHSITNVHDLFRIKIEDTVRVKFQSPFFESDYNSPESIEIIKDRILSSSFLTNYIINNDGTCSLMIIELDEFKKIDFKRELIINEIEYFAREELKSDSIYLGGLDLTTYAINKLSKRDFGFFMTISYLLICLITFFFFRRWQYVLLVLGTMLTSVVLTFSVYGLLGHRLNIFSIIIPTLIIIMGLINILHIINEFEIRINGSNQIAPREIVILESLSNVFRPCLFTALTTIIGFLALLSSSTAVLKEFGSFAALGIFIAFVCSFIFSAVVLQFIPLNNNGNKASTRIADKLILLSNSLQSNPRKYWSAILIITIITILGMNMVKSDMLAIGYLPESNEVVQDHNFITKHWGDYFPVDFLLHTRDSTNLRNPAILKALNEFQKEVVDLKEIKSGFSIINIVDRASQVILRRNIDKLLESPIQTDRLMRTLSRHKIDFSNLVSADFRTARVTFTGPMMSTSELKIKIDQITTISEKHFGDRASLSVSSYPALYLKIMKYAVDSMVRSLGVAVVLILITLAFLLKNLKLALVAMVPNLFPLFLMFAVMGFAGINLDIATATVASIALGVAVDDTIHFLSYYQKERRFNNKNCADAIVGTHYHIGRIIVISSIILCLGYLILLLASIKTAIYFGILTFVAVFGAMIGDLILLPLLLKLTDREQHT